MIEERKLFLFLVVLICFGCTPNHSKEIMDKRLPSLYIMLPEEQLDSIIGNRDHKASAYAVFVSSDGDTLFSDDLEHIKSRGNSTFNAEKKAFNIKLIKRKQFLNLKNGKRFVLLANAFDKSNIRNAIALDLAAEMGLPAPRYAFLSLYINSEYKGLYQITNKVEECMDINRIEGFLIEMNGIKIDNSIKIIFPKHLSNQENDSMTELYNERITFLSNCFETDESTDTWIQYNIDMQSFARYYLLQEITHNMDAGVNSFFMNGIDNTAKLYAGPVWDFDLSLCPNSWQFYEWTKDEIIANARIDSAGIEYSGAILHYLWKNSRFRDTVKYIYNNEISECCHKYLESGRIDSLVRLLESEAEKDYKKNGAPLNKNYLLETQKVHSFLKQRIEFLDWYFRTDIGERICVTYRDTWFGEWERIVQVWLPANNQIFIPKLLSDPPYNKAPIPFRLYYAGTDSIVPEGTIIQPNETLELKWRYPTWREVQLRRIKKKLKKLFG